MAEEQSGTVRKSIASTSVVKCQKSLKMLDFLWVLLYNKYMENTCATVTIERSSYETMKAEERAFIESMVRPVDLGGGGER
jgi:hypothetical protein